MKGSFFLCAAVVINRIQTKNRDSAHWKNEKNRMRRSIYGLFPLLSLDAVLFLSEKQKPDLISNGIVTILQRPVLCFIEHLVVSEWCPANRFAFHRYSNSMVKILFIVKVWFQTITSQSTCMILNVFYKYHILPSLL